MSGKRATDGMRLPGEQRQHFVSKTGIQMSSVAVVVLL